MDRDDHGCRYELVRIVRTIIKRDHILRLMTSYHAKHAFLRYVNKPWIWSGENALGDHLLGFHDTIATRDACKSSHSALL